MIAHLIGLAIERAARLRARDPETRLRAWLGAVSFVLLFAAAGWLWGMVVAAGGCVDACDPLAPHISYAGECYCRAFVVRP